MRKVGFDQLEPFPWIRPYVLSDLEFEPSKAISTVGGNITFSNTALQIVTSLRKTKSTYIQFIPAGPAFPQATELLSQRTEGNVTSATSIEEVG
jgi:hypothetical protein